MKPCCAVILVFSLLVGSLLVDPLSAAVASAAPSARSQANLVRAFGGPSGANGLIAFTSNRDGDNEIFVMNADGSNQVRITNNAFSDSEPSWSPDGGTLAFSSDRGGNRDIYLVAIVGGQPVGPEVNITNTAGGDFSPEWSPDGTKIAFSSDRGVATNLRSIYVMNVDGSNVVKLSNNLSQGSDFSPAWSPDGTTIAYGMNHHIIGSGFNSALYLINADGSNQRFFSLAAGTVHPTWSPDGTKLAFSAVRNFSQSIVTIGVDGLGDATVTTGQSDTLPAWSPDGTKIAFTRGTGGGPAEVFVVGADGSGLTNLTNNASTDNEPAWQFLPAPPPPPGNCGFVWTGPVTGTVPFETSTNWTPNGIPRFDDRVCFGVELGGSAVDQLVLTSNFGLGITEITVSPTSSVIIDFDLTLTDTSSINGVYIASGNTLQGNVVVQAGREGGSFADPAEPGTLATIEANSTVVVEPGATLVADTLRVSGAIDNQGLIRNSDQAVVFQLDGATYSGNGSIDVGLLQMVNGTVFTPAVDAPLSADVFIVDASSNATTDAPAVFGELTIDGVLTSRQGFTIGDSLTLSGNFVLSGASPQLTVPGTFLIAGPNARLSSSSDIETAYLLVDQGAHLVMEGQGTLRTINGAALGRGIDLLAGGLELNGEINVNTLESLAPTGPYINAFVPGSGVVRRGLGVGVRRSVVPARSPVLPGPSVTIDGCLSVTNEFLNPRPQGVSLELVAYDANLSNVDVNVVIEENNAVAGSKWELNDVPSEVPALVLLHRVVGTPLADCPPPTSGNVTITAPDIVLDERLDGRNTTITVENTTGAEVTLSTELVGTGTQPAELGDLFTSTRQIVVAPGLNTLTVFLEASSDSAFEGIETGEMRFTEVPADLDGGPPPPAIVTGVVRFSIVDQDSAPVPTLLPSVNVLEGDPAVFAVQFSGTSEIPLTFPVVLTPQTGDLADVVVAATAVDLSGTLVIPTFEDAIPEGDETLLVTVGGTAVGVLTVVEDDQLGFGIELVGPIDPVVEGSTAEFTLTFPGPTPGGVTIDWVTTVDPGVIGAGATPADPFTDFTQQLAGTIEVPANQLTIPLSVPVLTDAVADGGEVFGIELTINGMVGNRTAIATIADISGSTLTFENVSFLESVGAGRVTVTRSNAVGALTVAVTSNATGSALSVTDFTPVSTTLTFAAGESTAFVDVTIIDDAVLEPTETFQLSFDGGAFTTTITIVDDDPPFNVSLTASSPYAEDVGEISLNLRLDRVLDVPVTFQLRTIDGTAEAGEDFAGLATQSITIPAGSTEGPFVRVTIIDDTLAYELQREVFAVIVERNDILLAGTEIEIINDDFDAQARFVRQLSDPINRAFRRSVVEGDIINSTLPLFIELAQPVTEPTEVFITADSVDGTQGVDFELSTDTVVFQPGDTTQRVDLIAIADTVLEPDMEIVVALHTVAGDLQARIDDGAIITIVDDDQNLTLTPIIDTSVGEGDTLTVTVTADHAPGEFVTIPVTIRGVTANVGSLLQSLLTIGDGIDVDTSAVGPSITFGPDQTSVSFTVPIVDDNLPEIDEFFDIEFGTPNQGKVTTNSVQVTIADDDPYPLTLTVGDLVVGEGGLAELQLIVQPTGAPEVEATFPLPVTFEDVTARRGSDYVPLIGASSTVGVPLTGGTVTVPVLIVQDDRFDGDETFTVTFGRPGLPAEQVTATITITDDDPTPIVTIVTSSPYSEKDGTVNISLALSRPAGTPVTFNVRSVDGFAEAGEDFIALDTDITIPEGQTVSASFPLTILDDTIAFEFTEEVFGIEATAPVFDVEQFITTEVTIINDDRGPQARFVRQPADDPKAVLSRNLVEGNTVDTTLPLQVELLGDPITQPTTVTVVAQGINAAGDDFAVAPVELVFLPGETGSKTVTFTGRADTLIEPDELVIVALQTDFGDLLGRVDDEAQVTIVNDDDEVTAANAPAQFNQGWGSLGDAIAAWLRQFQLAPGDAPAVVTPQLADHFALAAQRDAVSPPALPSAPTSLGNLCSQLISLGITVDNVAGGICGRPAAAPGDFIQASYEVTLADLAKAAGFSADPFNDATDGVLTSLATGLGLNADPDSNGWIGDLTVRLVVGVDADGFYIDGATTLRLTVGGDLAISGNATLGGAAASFEGTADANLTVTLAPTQARQRNLADLLDPIVVGTASMDLAFGVGPLALAWASSWGMGVGGVTQDDQAVTGALTVPGLQDPSNDTALTVIAVRQGATWHVTAERSSDAENTLLGFDVGSISLAADIGPGLFTGSGSLNLVAPAPGQNRTVAVGVEFDLDSISFDGQLDLPELGVGSPELIRLTEAFVRVEFDAALPGGPLTGGVQIGAATAIVLPADPVGSATGLLGTLTSGGALTLGALTMETSIADGAILASLTDVAFRVGPGTGVNLLEVGTVGARFPALDDLAATFTGFFLTKDGRFGASSIAVASQGLARSIGLGGVLPFDITDVTVAFPDNSDLNRFEVSVIGSFDFAAFPDLGGFTPRVGLGGPVVTPASPPSENRFTFSVDVVSLADGVVVPLDVGPITLGFDGLSTGDYVIGADITLGGFVNGVFQQNVGGSLTVDGPAGSLFDTVTVDLDGTITPGATAADPTTADIAGTATLSGTLGPLEITNLVLSAGVGLSFGSGGLAIEPRLDGVTVGAVEFAFGDVMTMRATNTTFDPNPPAGGNYIEAGALTVEFDQGFEALAGWSGTARNIALGDDFVPKLLPNFGFDIGVPEDLDVGLPDFIPLFLSEAGLSFPGAIVGADGSVLVTPELFLTMRVRLSGGIRATETWPVSAAVDGLEIDLGLLLAGEFPITNLDGLAMGVEPFELPGGVTIGGGLELRTIDVDGTNVFYGRIFGDFSVADIGGGADLVITEYGPVLMKVNAPLGIPLGPTGVVLAGVSGAAQFGAVGIPVPPVGDPLALLNNFTLPTDLQITDEVIRDAVRPSIAVDPITGQHEYTWDQGFALSLAGELIVAAAPGVIKGTATIGMNLGLPEGPNDPAGLQLVGKGEITAFGIPMGEAGMLIDLSKPLEPSFDFAFASPAPGSPIALVVPGRATLGVQLRTDGVVLGTIEGLRAFVQELIDGLPGVAEEFFTAVLDELAERLDANRSRPFATLLLDTDGNGTLSTTERAATITTTFLFDRLLGRNGQTALLPAEVSPAAFERAAKTANAFFNELLLIGGEVITHPEAFGEFLIDSAAGGAGFEDLAGAAGDAMAALGGVIRNATSAALTEFGDRFNPSFTVSGSLQPTLLSLPIGSPVIGGNLFIDRNGLFLSINGSLTQIGKSTMGLLFPPFAPLIDAAMSVATLGISDQIEIGARLPFGGIIDSLIGGTDLPTFQPLDPNWAVTFTGSISVLGFEGAELSGIAFLGGQETFLNSRVQKMYELAPGTPVNANLIPITTKAHFDLLVRHGGILLTASLRVPRLITQPAQQLAAFPAPPENPLEYLEWLNDVAAAATQTDTPARIQYFIPGISGVIDGDSAVEWAESLYLEGVWDGDMLGLDLGQATMNLTPAGLDVTGTFPLAGVTGTATLNTALLDGGARLPSAGVEINLDSTRVVAALRDLGLPSAFVPTVNATGRFRAFTPGFDPASTDPFRRNGGIEVSAQLGSPGLIGSVGFSFAVSPRQGGIDVRGTAFANRVGPVAGVEINNALINLDIVGGVASVGIDGSANVLGAAATVKGTLAGDLTGQLTFTFGTGPSARMDLAGAAVTGTAQLTLFRVNGSLRGSLAVRGVAALPSWLADAAGSPTLTVAGCVDTVGNMEVALSAPALAFGPNKLVRIGRAPGTVALPPSPAGCTLPSGSPIQSANGPLFRLRKAGTVITSVVNGSLEFTASGTSIAGLTVAGSFSTGTGIANLDVTFAAGKMALSGFEVSGSATVGITPGTFTMTVTGRTSISGLITDAVVTGTADQRGVSHLGVSVGSLNLSPLTISNATLGIDRTIPFSGPTVYALTAGANVSFTGVGSMRIDGTLNSLGNGSLAVSVTTLTVGGAQITNGVFAIVRNGSTISLSARGTFSLFGNSLEVVQASLTLTRTGAANNISGSLVIRPPASAPLTLGGWGLSGTLRMTFSGITSSISIEGGAVTIPGWGTVGVTAQISVPVANGSFFQLALPAAGLRLGGGVSPFFASGTFRLSFNNNVATLSATNPTLSWKDGNTTLASFVGPTVTIRSDGFVSASMNTFSAAAAGFSFTVPSLSLRIDPQGLNARLALGAGSVTIPGLPVITTPAIDIGTSSTFSKTLVADRLDLGFLALHGTLVFERQQGVFRLQFTNSSTGVKPFLRMIGLVDIPLPTFTVASNGTFVVDAAFPALGPDAFKIIGASMHLEKTGAALTTMAGSVTGGRLLIGTAEPIVLPSLAFDANSRLDKTFTVPSWDLGPFLSVTSADVRFRQLSSGVLRLQLTNEPSVSMFAGSTSLKFNDLLIESDGNVFEGSITGRLALFGTRLATATFDVTKSGDTIKVNLPSSRKAQLDLVFLKANLSGFARSDGSFSFTGSSSVSLGVSGFSFSGSTSVNVSSADGIGGSYDGRVCIGFCLTTGGSLRSDGRIKGFFKFDINNDGDLNDFGDINADWRVYLANGSVRVDINNDGDYDDFGDISIGSGTSADQTDPTMAQPPNITVNANIGTGGKVRVYYSTPIATDSGTTLTVTCTPASGSSFSLGATTVSCSATDKGNNTRTRTFTVTVQANATATTPTANNGATVTVIATGFLPGSIAFGRVQSEPIYLGVFTADANGNVTIDVVIPEGLPAGEHDIIIEGFSPNGAVYQFVQPIMVGDPAQVPAPAPEPVPAPAPAPAPPPNMTPGVLPVTGSDGGALPLLPLGALAIALGISMLWWRRRLYEQTTA